MIGRSKAEVPTMPEKMFSFDQSLHAYLNVFNDDFEPFITINLKDNISMARMKYPCRGLRCRHLQCFDFEVYVFTNSKKSTSGRTCPICATPTLLANVILDPIALCCVELFSNTDKLHIFADGLFSFPLENVAMKKESSNVVFLLDEDEDEDSVQFIDNSKITTAKKQSNASSLDGKYLISGLKRVCKNIKLTIPIVNITDCNSVVEFEHLLGYFNDDFDPIQAHLPGGISYSIATELIRHRPYTATNILELRRALKRVSGVGDAKASVLMECAHYHSKLKLKVSATLYDKASALNQKPNEEVRKKTCELIVTFLAALLKSEKSCINVQSVLDDLAKKSSSINSSSGASVRIPGTVADSTDNSKSVITSRSVSEPLNNSHQKSREDITRGINPIVSNSVQSSSVRPAPEPSIAPTYSGIPDSNLSRDKNGGEKQTSTVTANASVETATVSASAAAISPALIAGNSSDAIGVLSPNSLDTSSLGDIPVPPQLIVPLKPPPPPPPLVSITVQSVIRPPAITIGSVHLRPPAPPGKPPSLSLLSPPPPPSTPPPANIFGATSVPCCVDAIATGSNASKSTAKSKDRNFGVILNDTSTFAQAPQMNRRGRHSAPSALASSATVTTELFRSQNQNDSSIPPRESRVNTSEESDSNRSNAVRLHTSATAFIVSTNSSTIQTGSDTRTGTLTQSISAAAPVSVPLNSTRLSPAASMPLSSHIPTTSHTSHIMTVNHSGLGQTLPSLSSTDHSQGEQGAMRNGNSNLISDETRSSKQRNIVVRRPSTATPIEIIDLSEDSLVESASNISLISTSPRASLSVAGQSNRGNSASSNNETSMASVASSGRIGAEVRSSNVAPAARKTPAPNASNTRDNSSSAAIVETNGGNKRISNDTSRPAAGPNSQTVQSRQSNQASHNYTSAAAANPPPSTFFGTAAPNTSQTLATAINTANSGQKDSHASYSAPTANAAFNYTRDPRLLNQSVHLNNDVGGQTKSIGQMPIVYRPATATTTAASASAPPRSLSANVPTQNTYQSGLLTSSSSSAHDQSSTEQSKKLSKKKKDKATNQTLLSWVAEAVQENDAVPIDSQGKDRSALSDAQNSSLQRITQAVIQYQNSRPINTSISIQPTIVSSDLSGQKRKQCEGTVGVLTMSNKTQKATATSELGGNNRGRIVPGPSSTAVHPLRTSDSTTANISNNLSNQSFVNGPHHVSKAAASTSRIINSSMNKPQVQPDVNIQRTSDGIILYPIVRQSVPILPKKFIQRNPKPIKFIRRNPIEPIKFIRRNPIVGMNSAQPNQSLLQQQRIPNISSDVSSLNNIRNGGGPNPSEPTFTDILLDQFAKD